MDDNKKRILIIIGFLLFSIGLGYLIYRFFFAPTPGVTPTTTPPPVTESTGLPAGGTAGPRGEFPGGVAEPTLPEAQQRPTQLTTGQSIAQIEQVIRQPVVSPSLSARGDAVNFYNGSDGRFYRLRTDGSVEALSDQVFFNVQNVNWSPAQSEAIIEYPDGANIYYNFDTRRQVTLPKHWEDFSFAQNGTKIAAKSVGLAPENRWLIQSNPDGTGIELIEPMGENQDRVMVSYSPNNQVVALSLTGQPLGADRQEVLFVGLHGENFRSMIVEGRDLRSEWSPQGDKLLYSVYSARSNFQPELWVANAQGDAIGTGRKLLGVNTWADKCTFADDRFVYCGVPQSLELGAGFAPELANNTPHRVVRIDVESGVKTEIPLAEPHVIDTLFVGPDGQTIYFTDTRRSGVFRLPL